jgi:hypothetical protein
VSAGRDVPSSTYYKVLAPVTTEWEAFIHIDGYHRRHNGDHKPMNGKYAMSLWLPGDIWWTTTTSSSSRTSRLAHTRFTLACSWAIRASRFSERPNDGDNRINGGELRVQ